MPRRAEDVGDDLWRVLNCGQEQLTRGGAADGHRDRNGRLRSVLTLRGIDSRIELSQGLRTLAERVTGGETLPPVEGVALTA